MLVCLRLHSVTAGKLVRRDYINCMFACIYSLMTVHTFLPAAYSETIVSGLPFIFQKLIQSASL